MMVAAQEEEKEYEPMAMCHIVDTTTDAVLHFSKSYPYSFTGNQLKEAVAQHFGYVSDSFSLVNVHKSTDVQNEIVLDVQLNETLLDVCGVKKRHIFQIREMDGKKPTLKSIFETEGTQISDRINFRFNMVSDWAPAPPTSYSGYGYSSALVQSETGFTGLVNQAMTCYLNSLLQTLFMTPEFRNAVYHWAFDGSKEDAVKSIPYQLQRLFLQLQTSGKKAIETTDITKSFGWDSSEAWQQHDVQELMRVMFDALEKKWKDTDQAHLINQLYQGKIKDYVKCLQCGYESARTDCYLDIPLTIRPFGCTDAHGSVEESLDAFCKPETLAEGNQYFCERCNTKCDAHKGLKFLTFPYILTLQLKRFDFDYNTLHRIKLNDRMTFPDLLNLNYLIDGYKKRRSKDSSKRKSSNCMDTAAHNGETDEGLGEDSSVCTEDNVQGAAAWGASPLPPAAAADPTDSSVDTGSDEQMEVEGPYEYELFSIMIHSGSAVGGHYYAYIKSIEDGKWYSFNDQSVSPITFDDIRKTYGGSPITKGYYSSTFGSSTNAYMLVYRQIEPVRNETFLKVENLPSHLIQELEHMKVKDDEELKQKELERLTCKIKLFCFHPTQQKQLECRFEVHKDATLKDATALAWKQMDLEGVVPLERVRLVKYDDYNEYIERSFTADEWNKPMEDILDGCKNAYLFDLLMEVCHPDEQFEEYSPGGIMIKILLVDLDSETITGMRRIIRVHQTDTIATLKEEVAQAFGLNYSSLKCVLERYSTDLRPLLVDDNTVQMESFSKCAKVFVECSGRDEWPKLESQESPLCYDRSFFQHTVYYRVLDRFQNTIRLLIGLPAFSELERSLAPKLRSDTDAESDEGLGGDSEETEVGAHSVISDPTSGVLSDSSVSSHRRAPSPMGCSHSKSSPEDLDKSDPVTRGTSEPSLCSASMAGVDGAWNGGGDDSASSLDSSSTVASSTGTMTECPPDRSASQEHLPGTCSPTQRPRSWPDGIESGSAESTEAAEKRTEWWNEKNQSQNSSHNSVNNDAGQPASEEDEFGRYFSATLGVDTQSKENFVTAFVDKRMTYRSLKKSLEHFVGCSSENFKLYRVYSSHQEMECTRMTESLSSLSDDCKLLVRLGRALRRGEFRSKLYLLQINNSEPTKYVGEVILSKGVTVAQAKELALDEMRSTSDVVIPLERLRLRKKTWRSPGCIYNNNAVFEVDISLISSSEFFLEDAVPPMCTETPQGALAVYTRWWRPSKYQVEPFQEVLVYENSMDSFKQALSQVSGIPVNQVEIAKGKGAFPCDMSVLDVHTELEWNPNVGFVNIWPLSLCDDGCVVYFRDNEEELMKLSEEKKRELQHRENIRLATTGSYTSKSSYSRKERALKIYTDDGPDTTNTTNTSYSIPSVNKSCLSDVTVEAASSETAELANPDNNVEIQTIHRYA